MTSAVIQLIVLAAIAVFLILRLRNVLGTREGFEKPPTEAPSRRSLPREFEVIEGGVDSDIADHAPEGSSMAAALAEMKAVDPDFSVGEFLHGARSAYEMILMAYETGSLGDVRPFLSDEVYETFAAAVEKRREQGLTVEAEFVGLRDVALADAKFDVRSGEAELTVRFTGEMTSVVRNASGDIVEGSPSEIRRQRDVWTFSRRMDSDDPNWQLVATGG